MTRLVHHMTRLLGLKQTRTSLLILYNTIVTNDKYSMVHGGQYIYEFYVTEDETQQMIGYMSLRPHNGQIGKLFILPEYRGKGLCNEMLRIAGHTRYEWSNRQDLWVLCYEKHPFWSTRPHLQWLCPVHISVDGGGYHFIPFSSEEM